MIKSTLFALTTGLLLAPVGFAADIKIGFSKELTEELSDEYGTREGERLATALTKDLERALGDDITKVARLDIIIEDAKPNRPTFKQLGDRPGLSMRSISIGGAKVTGEAYDTEGNLIAEVDYKWYENDIRQVSPAGVWSDANRAFDRFSRKLAREVRN